MSAKKRTTGGDRLRQRAHRKSSSTKPSAVSRGKGKPAPPATPVVRGAIWIEIGQEPALTEAGADLLAQIDAQQSLSEAARRLRYSYRRAWLLVDEMNRRWSSPLVHTAVGGKHGGGTTLTPMGHHVLKVYRDLQIRLEHLLDADIDPFKPYP